MHAVPVIYLTIDRLRTILARAMPTPEVASANTLTKVRSLKGRVGAIEARVRDLEPRSAQVDQMIARIESGYQAAEQLPTDLMQLEEDRRRMTTLCEEAEKSAATAQTSAKYATQSREQLDNIIQAAQAVLQKCESAYTAATSQGLAAAFAERSKSLDRSMWAWVAGMIVALTAGAYFGSQRLGELQDLVKNPNLGVGTAVLNFLLAILSVGGPIWLSWIATKQISQRFRLAEDYAFKAAVSRAYEGYRKEAARVDKELEAKLLLSALTRLDEQPLRFVDAKDHGSPWQEMLASDAVQSAVKSIPGFAEKMIAEAKGALSNLGAVAPQVKKADLTVVADEKTATSA